MSLLRLTGASAALGGRSVLSRIDLTVEPGEFVAVCGPNGAGKSSLLRAALTPDVLGRIFGISGRWTDDVLVLSGRQ